MRNSIAQLVVLLAFSMSCSADVSHFSLSTQILSIPFAVLDDTVFYENVEIGLNTITEQFSVIDGSVVNQLDDPDSATRYSSQTKTLSIPFAALDGQQFFENVEIVLDQDTGFFQVISGFEVGPPTQTFLFRLELGESVKLFNADTLVYTDKGADSRCPFGTMCQTPGFVQAGLQMPIEAPGTTFFTPPLNGIGGTESTSITVNGKYRLRLLESNPYPQFVINGGVTEVHHILVEFQFVGTEL